MAKFLSRPSILITGGAGYIGSHAVLALKQQGYDVIILDNLVSGHRDLVESVLDVELIVGDIHVSDLADAHILGLAYLLDGGETNVFNLGNGNGFSVREVIETARQVTVCDIPVVESGRRLGDPPMLVGSSEKVSYVLGWRPQYASLHKIISDAWQWHQKCHGWVDSTLKTTPALSLNQ